MNNDKNHEINHPLLNLSRDIQINYFSIIAFMAGADGIICKEELNFMDYLCNIFKVDENEREKIMEGVRAISEDIDMKLASFSSSNIRFTFLCDLTSMANADGIIVSEEENQLKETAKKINVTPEQLDKIIDIIKNKNISGDLKCMPEDFLIFYK